eukprot:15399135-Alexandrium_andersonii.AAC.1
MYTIAQHPNETTSKPPLGPQRPATACFAASLAQALASSALLPALIWATTVLWYTLLCTKCFSLHLLVLAAGLFCGCAVAEAGLFLLLLL